MTDRLALGLALVALSATLVVAVVRPPRLPEAVVAAGGALLLLAVGAIGVHGAGDALRGLGPTIGFLAAVLVLADGCRREGVFEALGTVMARASGGEPRRLLGLVFVAAAATTAVLSLDATIVLLTPVVFATATQLRVSTKPHVYACAHLANSASLLLPVSNLTNLLAFNASGLSFISFAALMALPTLAVLIVEWVVLGRWFAGSLHRSPRAVEPPPWPVLPRFALTVLAVTLVGFAASSAVAVPPVWFAVAGAVAITVPALARGAVGPVALLRALEPGFLVFVAGLGVIVHAAGIHGLDSAVRTVLPAGHTLVDLLAVAGLSALLANLVNNLPATLILVPVAAAAGTGPVLAVLIGVNVGPNLTYVGSLATLLWRRLLRAQDTDVSLGEFLGVGALTVPAGVVVATVCLWVALRV